MAATRCYTGYPYHRLRSEYWFDPAVKCTEASNRPCFIHLRKGSYAPKVPAMTQPIETDNFVVLQNGTWNSYDNEEWVPFAGEQDSSIVSDTFVIANAIEQIGLQEFARRVIASRDDRLGVLVVYHKQSGETYAISNADSSVHETNLNSHTLYAARTSTGWIYASKLPENMNPVSNTRLLASETDEISFWKLTSAGPVQCEIDGLPGQAGDES